MGIVVNSSIGRTPRRAGLDGMACATAGSDQGQFTEGRWMRPWS